MASNFFTLKDIYPESSTALFFELKKIDEIKNDALILLDTNILLLPYKTNSESLNAIRQVYSQLISTDQLYVPAHTIREFLKNRPDKLSEIVEALNKKSSSSFQYVDNYPVLTNLEEYSELAALGVELKARIKEYQDKIRSIMSTIQSWTWDDSVSLVYKELFVDRILDGNIEMSDLERELEKRNTLSQPPGFKDKGKDLNASGDLIIWKEILKCAQEKGKDVIFISADEKNDWWHKSNKEGLYPRFELIDEFRRVTAGKSFHIISLSKLLKIFDASANVIQSVEETENNIADETSNIEKEYNDYLNYRRYLNIPKNHKIEVVDDGRNTKNRLDTDIYIIYEYDAEGGVIRKYKLYDSTHMDPPFNRELYAENI
ncbi:PIN domain-containing protein [Acinetobacter haemolyticus]|uniref:PIN domain-containing protein n=1 Tax=Acinetobacter haemolyticus TaxID=29430 RepID=UPI000E12D518|nr:PIN domain-containing protein [Acinetobacter haemolyticus]SUU24462.1 Uncharacterised protein [Acinetobacter haemolyticus]